MFLFTPTNLNYMDFHHLDCNKITYQRENETNQRNKENLKNNLNKIKLENPNQDIRTNLNDVIYNQLHLQEQNLNKISISNTKGNINENYIIINEICPNNEKPDLLTLHKNRRNSNIHSQRPSGSFSELKNFIPYTLIKADKIQIPVLLKGKSLNNSVSEEEDPSEETIKVNSIVEDISNLYSKEDEFTSEKHTLIMSELNKINLSSFNVFKLSEFSDNLELFYLMNHLFTLHNFERVLNVNKIFFRNFFLAINENYRKNPYHNSIHGCDVTQTIYYLIKSCAIEEICKLNNLDLFSIYFASAIHDVDHPGNNNNWEITIKSSLALSYNDRAVLENYHICKAYSLLKRQDCNVFSNFSINDYNKSRGMIINMVLSTDMANHFSDLANLNTRGKSEDFSPANTDKQLILNQLVHSCDISNPLKPMEIYIEWVQRVFSEFFSQGDKERENNFKISFLCDRNTTNVIDAQIGFIDGIVFPLFNVLTISFPDLKKLNEVIEQNRNELKKMKQNNVMIKV